MASNKSQIVKDKVPNFWEGAKNFGSNLLNDAGKIGSATIHHISGGVIDFVKEYIPASSSIIDELPDVFGDIKNAYKQGSSSLMQDTKSLLKMPSYRGILDWYTAKEEDLGGMFGGDDNNDSELNFDLGESSVTAGSSESPDNSATDELVAEFKIADKASNKVAAAVVETSKKNAELQVTALASMTHALDKTNSILTAGFESVNKSIQDLTSIVTKNTEAIIKVIEIGKQLDQATSSSSSRSDTLTYADLLAGRFDLKKYSKFLGNKVQDAMGMVDYFKNQGGNLQTALISAAVNKFTGEDINFDSPKAIVKWGIDKVVDTFLPDIRQGLKSIDTGITKWIQQTVLDLGQGFFMGQKLNDFWMNIANFFGIGKESGMRKEIQRNDFEHKQISFDTETKESIVKVIPAYLERITNALTGKEYHYDLKQRSLKTKEQVQASYLQQKSSLLNTNTSEYNRIMKEVLEGNKDLELGEDDNIENNAELNILFKRMMRQLYQKIVIKYESTDTIIAQFGRTESAISEHIAKEYLGFEGGLQELKERGGENKIIQIKRLAHMIAAIAQNSDLLKNLTKDAYDYQRNLNDYKDEVNQFYENQNSLDLFKEVDDEKSLNKFEVQSQKILSSKLSEKVKYVKMLKFLKMLQENKLINNIDRFKDLWEDGYGDKDQNEEIKSMVDFLKKEATEGGILSKGIQNEIGQSFILEDKYLNEIREKNANEIAKSLALTNNKSKIYIAEFEKYVKKLEEDYYSALDAINYDKDTDLLSKIDSEAESKISNKANETLLSAITRRYEMVLPNKIDSSFDGLNTSFREIVLGKQSKENSFAEVFREGIDRLVGDGVGNVNKIYDLLTKKEQAVQAAENIIKTAATQSQSGNIFIPSGFNLGASNFSNLTPTSKPTPLPQVQTPTPEPISASLPTTASTESSSNAPTNHASGSDITQLNSAEEKVLSEKGKQFAHQEDNSNPQTADQKKLQIKDGIENYIKTGTNSLGDIIDTKKFTPDIVKELARNYGIDEKQIPTTVLPPEKEIITKAASMNSTQANVSTSTGINKIQEGVKAIFNTATGSGSVESAKSGVGQIVQGTVQAITDPVIKPMQESLKPIGQHITASIFGGTFEERVVDDNGQVKVVTKRVKEGGLLGFFQDRATKFFTNLIPSEDKIDKVNKDVTKSAKRMFSKFKVKDKNGKKTEGEFDWEGLTGRIVGTLGGGMLAGPIGSIIGLTMGHLLPIAPIGNAIKNFVVGDLFDKHADPKNPKMGFFEKVFFNWIIPFKTEFGKTMKFLFANVKRNIIGPFLQFGTGIATIVKKGFMGIGQMPWFRALGRLWKNSIPGKFISGLWEKFTGGLRWFFGGIGRLFTGGLARLFGGLSRGLIGVGTGILSLPMTIANGVLGAVGGKDVRHAMSREGQRQTGVYNRDLSKNGLLSINGAIGELFRGNFGYAQRMFTDKDSIDWWWGNAKQNAQEREDHLKLRANIRDFFTGGNEAKKLEKKSPVEQALDGIQGSIDAIGDKLGVTKSKAEANIAEANAKAEEKAKELKEAQIQGEEIEIQAATHAMDTANDLVMSGEMTRQEANTMINRVNAKLPSHLKVYGKRAQMITLAASATNLRRTGHEEGLWGKIKDWAGTIFPAIGTFISGILGPIGTAITAAAPVIVETLPTILTISSAVVGLVAIIKNWGNIGELLKGFGEKASEVATNVGDAVSTGWSVETKGDKLRNSALGKTVAKGFGQTAIQAATDFSERQILRQGQKDAKAMIKDAAANANRWAAISEGNSKRITEASKKFNEALKKDLFASDKELVNTVNQAAIYEKKAKEAEEALNKMKGKYGEFANMTEKEIDEVAKKGSGFHKVKSGVVLSIVGLVAMGSIELALKSLISWVCLNVLKLNKKETVEICSSIMKWGDVVLFLIPQSFYQKIALGFWNLLKGSFDFVCKRIVPKLGKMFNAVKTSFTRLKDLGNIIKNAFKPQNLADTALKKIEAGAAKATGESIEKTVAKGAAKIGVEVSKAGGINWPEIIIMGAVGAVIGNLSWPEAFEIPDGAMTGITGDYQNKMKNISVAINGLFWGIPNGFIAEMVMELLLSPEGNTGKGILSFFIEKGYQIPNGISTFKGLLCWIFLNILSEDKKAQLETVVNQTSSQNEYFSKLQKEYGLTDEEVASMRETSTNLGSIGKTNFDVGTMYRKTGENSNIFGSKTRTATMYKGKRLLRAGSIDEKNKVFASDFLDKYTLARTTKGGKILSENSIWNQGAIKYWNEKFGVDINNPDNVEEKTITGPNGMTFTGYQIIGEPGTKALFHFDPFVDLNGDSKKVPEFVAFKEYLRAYLEKIARYLISKTPRYYSFLNSIKGSGRIIGEDANYNVPEPLKTGSNNDLIVTYNSNGKIQTKNALWALTNIFRNAYKKDITKENIIRNGGINKLFQKALSDFNIDNSKNLEKYQIYREAGKIQDFLRKLGDDLDFTNEKEDTPDSLNVKYNAAKQVLSKMIGMGEGYNPNDPSSRYNYESQHRVYTTRKDLETLKIKNRNKNIKTYISEIDNDPNFKQKPTGPTKPGFDYIYEDYKRLQNNQPMIYHQDKTDLINSYYFYKSGKGSLIEQRKNIENKKSAEYKKNLEIWNKKTYASNIQASVNVVSKNGTKKDAKISKKTAQQMAGNKPANTSEVAKAEEQLDAVPNPIGKNKLVFAVSKMTWEQAKSLVTSPYGQRDGRFHHGIDIGIPEGTTLVAMGDGIITGKGWQFNGVYGYGYWLTYKIIDSGLNILYGHLMEEPKKLKGEHVRAGEPIALSGNTGGSTGPHLHLEMRPGAPGTVDDWDSTSTVNPADVLDGLTVVAADGTYTSKNGKTSKSKSGGLLGWLQKSSPYGALLSWLGSIFTGNSEDSSSSETSNSGVSANLPIAANDANRDKIYKLLRNKGFSKEAAIGILANIQQESTFRPDAINPESGAYGICQWYQDRKTGLEKYAASKGKSPSDLETQVDFLIHELDSNPRFEKVKGLKNTTDRNAMVRAFVEDFEVPEVKGSTAMEMEVSKRIGHANALQPYLLKLEEEPNILPEKSVQGDVLKNTSTQFGVAGGIGGESFASLNPFKGIQNMFNDLGKDVSTNITSNVMPQISALENDTSSVSSSNPTMAQTKAMTKNKTIEEKMDIMIGIFTQILQMIKQGNTINTTSAGFLENLMNISSSEKQKVLDRIRKMQQNQPNPYVNRNYPLTIQNLVTGYS